MAESEFEVALRDPLVRVLGALRSVCDVLPGSPGHAVWNFWTELQDERVYKLLQRTRR